jgi:sensor histidine kinase YesM
MRARMLDGELACTTELFNVVIEKQTYKDNKATTGGSTLHNAIPQHRWTYIHTCFTIPLKAELKSYLLIDRNTVSIFFVLAKSIVIFVVRFLLLALCC